MKLNFILIICLLSVLFIILFIYRLYIGNKLKKLNGEKKQYASFTEDEIITYSQSAHTESDDKRLVNQLINPDNVNAEPLAYMVIDDGGKSVYVRTFTITAFPKTLSFGITWSAIANYEGVISSVYVRRLSKKEASSMFDKHITELQSEIYRAEDLKTEDPNRARKLRRQRSDTEKWAEKAENDEELYYSVGFLLTIKAESFSELNLKSDSFFKAASKKSILISNCYGLQEEAYKSNMPFNTIISKQGTEPINWFLFSRKALASLYNHTRTKFVHENGVPIGSGLYDGDIATWDPYDKSHVLGYSAIFAGFPGVGKSATVKSISTKLTDWGVHFIAIDSQGVGGRGEYTSPALSSNGVVYRLGKDSKWNLFDIKPSKSGGTLILNLKDKVESLLLSITILLEAEDIEFKEASYLKDILKKAILESYEAHGIKDGDVDSLYEEGSVVENGKIMSGRRRKKLPELGLFYKQLLIDKQFETNDNKREIYEVVLANLSTYIEGVYYGEKSLTFFTKEEYEKLDKVKENHREFRISRENGVEEKVIAVEGQLPYFDGQSTVDTEKDYPYISYDISALPQREKNKARALLMPYIEENYVNQNNENVDEAKKLIIIFDEAKEHWDVGETTRKQSDRFARQCRKKNVGVWWILQSIADTDIDKSTRSIFKFSDTKFIFKQDISDDGFMKENLPLSDIQRNKIYSLNGVKERGASSYSKPGQLCLIDSGTIYFVQIDLMPSEKIIMETDMRKLQDMRKRGEVFWDEVVNSD